MDKKSEYLLRIREVYPDLEVSDLRTDRGQFNDVLVVDGELIFRFPRYARAAEALETETAILRALKGRVPLPVPDPIYTRVEPSTGRQTLMGYRMIPGEPLWNETVDAIGDGETLRRLATQLADFLRALHSVPVSTIGLDLPITDDAHYWSDMYGAFRQELFGFMRLDARRAVERSYEAFLGEPRNFQWRPVLRHGDFGGSNILYDPWARSISGVIDFGSAGLGDPAVDLGPIVGYGEAFVRWFYMAYPELASPAVVERTWFYRSTYALQQALWALRAGDEKEFQDGIAAYV